MGWYVNIRLHYM